MKLNKPKFWNVKNSFFSFFLIPIALIVILIIFFKKKITKSIKFNIPIICIGNIYIGGTGKTPAAIYIANELLKLGKKPSILRKFYKGHKDEYGLIRKNFKNLILNTSREEGILEAQKMNSDIVILDDGFQDYKIKKDFNIICFNENQLIGNGLVIPSGPLREGLGGLKNANAIFFNGKKNKNFESKILKINSDIEIFYTNYMPININQFKEKNLLALAGIGNPENFFLLLENYGLNIEKKITFPDHYEFNKREFLDILKEAEKNNLQIIMTEKDYFKIKDFNIDNIKYLKISLKIDQKEKFIKLLSRIYDKKN